MTLRSTLTLVLVAATLACVGCKNPPRLEADAGAPSVPLPSTEWGPVRTPVEGAYRDSSEVDPLTLEPDIGDAVPPGKHVWDEGYYETTEEIAWEEAWRASKMAYEDLRFPVVREKRTSFQGWLVGKMPEGQHCRLDFYRRGEELTGIRIRYGLYGSLPGSRALNELIRAKHDELLARGETMEAERAAAEAAAEAELQEFAPPEQPREPEATPDMEASPPPAPPPSPERRDEPAVYEID